MPLETGARLGPYEITATIGAGGMGEVYRARDHRLDRDVAVKVLPEVFATDSDRRARFEREARAVAALTHPNILILYDICLEGATAYAVTELLEGQTLDRILAEGRPSLRKSIDWAVQMARGLGAAHARGIVHRDVKPSNLFVTADGTLKILDFGLARAMRAASGPLELTVASPVVTEPGMVMGTAAYMSPEQARGLDVDHRSDLFAFGAVLYELLTGSRAFERETTAETMTAVIREEPNARLLDASGTPPALGRVVWRCLEKDPANRFQTARDLGFAIENTTGAFAVEAALPPAIRGRRFPAAAVVAGALALAAVASLATLWLRPSASVAEPVRIRQLTFSGRDSEPSASPDARMIAFTSARDGTSRIWLKQLAGGGEQVLTRGLDWRPAFTPDGSAVLFLRHEGSTLSLYRIALVGGHERKLLSDVTDAAMSPDGKRLAFIRGGISHSEGVRIGVASDDGRDERIIAALSSAGAVGIAWSADGKLLATTQLPWQGAVAGAHVRLLSPESGEVRELAVHDDRGYGLLSGPAWDRQAHVLFIASATNSIGDQSGLPGRVVLVDPNTSRRQTLFWAGGLFPFRGSRNSPTTLTVLGGGRIVFDVAHREEALHEVQLDSGTDRVLTFGTATDRQPVYSADDRSVLFTSNRTGNLDLWTLDLASGTLRQLTDDPAQDWDPAFTPDGRQIVFSSDRGGHLEIWMADADGANLRQVSFDGLDAENPTMTHDGKWIVYSSGNPDKLGIWRIRPDGSDAAQIHAGNWINPEVSPDGRYTLYVGADESALVNTIRVAEVETGRQVDFRIQIRYQPLSPNVTYGRARWMPDGRALAFVGLDERGLPGIYVQDFEPGRDTIASRRPLAGFHQDRFTESFGISRDGGSIILGVVREIQNIMLAEGIPGVR